MENPPTAAEPPIEERSWSRAMLLRELRKPIPSYRWEWVGSCLWPLAAVCGAISYRGFMYHGWPAINYGCALLCFNFAVSAIVNQAMAPLRRKIAIMSELIEDEEQSGL